MKICILISIFNNVFENHISYVNKTKQKKTRVLQRHEKKVNIIESYLVDVVASTKSDLPHPGMLFCSAKLSGFPRVKRKGQRSENSSKSDF